MLLLSICNFITAFLLLDNYSVSLNACLLPWLLAVCWTLICSYCCCVSQIFTGASSSHMPSGCQCCWFDFCQIWDFADLLFIPGMVVFAYSLLLPMCLLDEWRIDFRARLVSLQMYREYSQQISTSQSQQLSTNERQQMSSSQSQSSSSYSSSSMSNWGNSVYSASYRENTSTTSSYGVVHMERRSARYHVKYWNLLYSSYFEYFVQLGPIHDQFCPLLLIVIWCYWFYSQVSLTICKIKAHFLFARKKKLIWLVTLPIDCHNNWQILHVSLARGSSLLWSVKEKER